MKSKWVYTVSYQRPSDLEPIIISEDDKGVDSIEIERGKYIVIKKFKSVMIPDGVIVHAGTKVTWLTIPWQWVTEVENSCTRQEV